MKTVIAFFIIVLSPLAIFATQTRETFDTIYPLGDVTVTAIKQTRTLATLQQPTAITQVRQPEIERQNISDIKGISSLAPNFYAPEHGSRITSSIYVRGLGARLDQAAVGMSVDNVGFLNKDAYDFTLSDISRIDVIRGAQSSLYGRNSMAGQINIYTLSPMDWQGTRIGAQLATGPEARLDLSHYWKRQDGRLATSFSGNFNFSDGFDKNYYNARKVGTDKSLGLRWKTQWRPSGSFSLDNALSFSLSRQGGYPYELLGSGKVNYNDSCYYRRNLLSEGLTLNWITPHFSLTAITGLQYMDDCMGLDQDFTPLKMFTLTQKRHELSLTQDIVMRGAVGQWTWLAGAFGFIRHTSMRAPVNILSDGISTLITGRVNNNPNIPIKLQWQGDSLPLYDDFTLPVWGLALYHQSNWRIGHVNIGLGMRLDYEKTGLNYHSYTSTAYSVVLPNGMAMPKEIDISDVGRLRKDHWEFLPKVSVSYTLPTPQPSTIYFSAGKGYKSGGYNTQMFSEVMQRRLMTEMMQSMPGTPSAPSADGDISHLLSYKAEQSWNYEAGIHMDCDGGRVQTDLALFYIDCRNQQLTMFPKSETTTGRITTNAPRSRMTGVEAQIRYAPTSRWLFNMSYGFTDARFRHFSIGDEDYRDCHVPYAPAHTLFAAATYRQPLPWNLHQLDFTASCRGDGRIWWDEANTSSRAFSARLRLSMVAHFSWLDAEAWLDNVTGTRQTVFQFTSMGQSFIQRAQPRQGGVTLRFKFK